MECECGSSMAIAVWVMRVRFRSECVDACQLEAPVDRVQWEEDWDRCGDKRGVIRGIMKGLNERNETGTAPGVMNNTSPMPTKPTMPTTRPSTNNSSTTARTNGRVIRDKHLPRTKTATSPSPSPMSSTTQPSTTPSTPFGNSGSTDMPTRWLMSGLVAMIALAFVVS